MNKRFPLLFLVLLLVFAVEAKAQSQPAVGLRAGGSLAQLRGEDDVFGGDATELKLGLTVGAFAEVPINRQFSVQPELLYTQKGGTMDEFVSEDGVEGEVESNFNLHYLELPVLAKYNVPMRSQRFAPSIYAGPYVSYSIGRDMDIDFEGSDGNDFSLSLNADDVFERFDYGAVAGVDFGYRFAQRMATIGVRYDLGLANVFKDDAFLLDEFGEQVPLGDVKARNHEVSLILGLRLF